MMIGDGGPAFAAGFRRYRVTQGGSVAYVVVSADGRVVGADREPWLRFNWKVLRRRLLQRPGCTIEELDGSEDKGAGAPEAPPEVAE